MTQYRQYPQYIQSTRYDNKSDQQRSARGMSLVEAMVSLLLLSLIMVAFLGVLDSTSRVAKIQGNIADSTENLRFSMAALVRVVRMAGTGGLPIVVPDGGTSYFPLAIDVIDHTDTGTAEDYGGKTRLPGTDVLHIRGVIVEDLVDFEEDESGAMNGGIDFTTNTLVVPFGSAMNRKTANAATGGVGQGAVEADPDTGAAMKKFILMLNTPLDISTGICGIRHYNQYRMVETLDDANAIVTVETGVTTEGAPIGKTTILFKTDAPASVALNPDKKFETPADPTMVYAVGFVDDMHFFIAENALGEPSLYRWIGTGNAEELVSNIANLQIALGCDINCDGVLADSEWYYSTATPGGPTNEQLNTLREVRISLVARSMDPDRTWSDDSVMPENAAQLSGDDLNFRHRVVTVRTGLRSHPSLEGV